MCFFKNILCKSQKCSCLFVFFFFFSLSSKKQQQHIINSVAPGCSRQPLSFSMAVSGQGWYVFVFLFTDSSEVKLKPISNLCWFLFYLPPMPTENPCCIFTCRLSIRDSSGHHSHKFCELKKRTDVIHGLKDNYKNIYRYSLWCSTSEHNWI